MALCPSNKKIYDPIRCCFVAATPEEYVRQKLIYQMISELGYPKSLLAVEKQVVDLPHLVREKKDIPHRRIDLICFDLGIEAALLLVECKTQVRGREEMTQILGYRSFIHAKAICLAYPDRVWLGWKEKGKEKEEWLAMLPHFDKLRRQS